MAIGDFIKKAKSYAQQNPDKVKQTLDKVGSTVDQKTGGKYRDKVDKATGAVGGALGVDKQEGQQGSVDGGAPQAQPDPGQPQPDQQGAAPEWKGTDGADGQQPPQQP